jgi:hypothetical protein
VSKRIIAMVAAVVVAAGLMSGVSLVASSPPAQALSGADFDPGNIITDQVFFNSTAMSEAQIQSFLTSRIGACTNSNCLSAKKLDTSSRAADAMCRAYQGAAQEPVSRIIAKVAQACGINPQVLLVTLQKEQSLVTGSIAKGPSDARLQRAMGYACPDSADGGCDPSFAGVYNQLYKASWQFKRYANPAGTSNFFTQYAPGANRNVLYNPNAACGSKTVFIKNQATANLYYYTPYTPNAAALANLNGSGDSCSAYGNRNFWVYFSDWFGSPTGPTKPFGSIESLRGTVGKVEVSGWAVDPATSASIAVHVYVGPKGSAVRADRQRPDVGAVYPALGSAHGYSASIDAAPGTWDVCVYAIGVAPGNTSSLGCRTATVLSPSPVGVVDSISAGPGQVSVSGWALDHDTTASIPVHVYVDGKGTALVADQNRSDIGRAFPAYGPAHGFSTTVAAAPGAHDVCVYAINVGAGATVTMKCAKVTVPSGSPIGVVDTISASSSSITVGGWALDPDTTASIPVHVYVDGVGRALTADQPRSDIARSFPAYGAAHGFSTTVPVRSGSHQVCVYAINVGAGSTVTMRCQTVVTTNAPPTGSSESVVGVAGGVKVTGWAFDRDAPSTSIPVHVYVDGKGTALVADGVRRDVGRAFGMGDAHGYQAVVPAARGERQVCIYALDTAGGANPQLSCGKVVVP